MKDMKKIFTIIFAALFTLPAMADTTIRGITVDAQEGLPLPGVYIVAVGDTSRYVVSDSEGEYTFTIPDNISQVTFSVSTYKDKTLDVAKANGIVPMQYASQTLDRVIVTACRVKPGSGVKSAQWDLATKKCYPTECESDNYVLTNPRTALYIPGNSICIGSTGAGGPCENYAEYAPEVLEITVGDACTAKSGQSSAGTPAPSGDEPDGTPGGTTENNGGGTAPADDKTTTVSGNCDQMPEHATAAHKEWNATLNAEICVVTTCADGYRPSDDKQSCVSDSSAKELSQQRIDELQKNADAMKAKEQSTGNRLLGAASIGATGIGGMQLASAMAENRADDAAERDMAAYLATFRCDYGQGRNIAGGETDVQLPGGNTLLQLRQEFATLSTDVKTRKEALGLTPGIESEVVMDSANMGLYDDVSLGRTDGAYTSLSRALSDSTGADAAEWAQQRADTSSQLKTGAITAGIGIVGGVVGDLLINRNAPKESSDEINTKYDALERLRDETEKLPNSESGAQCPSGSTGTFPNCVCTDKNYVHSANDNTCQRCPGTKVANENGTACVCPDGTAPGENDTCNTISATVTVQCDQTDPNVKVDTSTGACSCMNGYRMVNNKCTCPSDKYEINENGLCVEIQVTVVQNTPAPTPTPPERQVLPSSNLFDLGKANLRSDAMLKIGDFAGQVKSTQGTDTNYCITVVGHTDRSGTDKINIPLSQNRAKAVGNALVQAGLPTDNIRTSGVGSTECDTPDTKPNEACRKVVISFSPNKCQ